MSKTPVVPSAEANFRVASHLSKVPSRATDAFTKNLIELSPGVISKMGTSFARHVNGSTEQERRQKIARSTRASVSPPAFMSLVLMKPLRLTGETHVRWAVQKNLRVLSACLGYRG